MPQPPVAKLVPAATTVLGDTRTDNYAWLRNRNDPDTIAYLEAENAYTDEVMKPTEELRAKLYQEMLGRIKQTDSTVPVRRDEYFYYTRTEEGKQYSIYCRKHGSLDAPDLELVPASEVALLQASVLDDGLSLRVSNPEVNAFRVSMKFEVLDQDALPRLEPEGHALGLSHEEADADSVPRGGLHRPLLKAGGRVRRQLDVRGLGRVEPGEPFEVLVERGVAALGREIEQGPVGRARHLLAVAIRELAGAILPGGDPERDEDEGTEDARPDPVGQGGRAAVEERAARAGDGAEVGRVRDLRAALRATDLEGHRSAVYNRGPDGRTPIEGPARPLPAHARFTGRRA